MPNHGGEICYNKKITNGALWPLKLQFKQFFEHRNNLKSCYDRLENFKTNKATTSALAKKI